MNKFWSLARRVGQHSRSLPLGQRIYAVGDIHGRSDLLQFLSDAIEEDVANSGQADSLCVFLGDYIDRGPASNKVLSCLAAKDFPIPLVALRGNHEEMLLRFLDDATYLENWRRFGGLETLASFGISIDRAEKGQGYEAAQERLRRAMTPEQLAFLRATEVSYASGDYFFCHAGIRPDVSLDDQLSKDLLWIRHDFLQSDAEHGKMIVHGHTPVDTPDILPNRINIDTRAYQSGVLTCLVLEGATRRFLTT